MFASIARCYDLNNRVHSLGRDQAWRREAVRLSGVRPGERVVDVACGTGDLTAAFAAAGPAGVIGIDFTEPMLAIARRKAARRGGTRVAGSPAADPRPHFVAGDAMALPLADASVDIVSIAFGIRNVADPSAALREFHRVLRGSGRLVVLEFSEPRNGAVRRLNRLYTQRVMPITATLLSRDRSGAYRYLPRSIDTFLDRGQMVAAMEAAGFRGVRAHPMTFGVCVAYVGQRA